jgi:benzoylformate decarboxylase
MRGLFRDHDVAFLCGFSNQAQLTVFKYEDGPLIPDGVRQVYLTNNTWDIGKNYYGEVAVLGDVKATLPLLNQALRKAAPAGAAARNTALRKLDADRRTAWQDYLKAAQSEKEIWAVVIADALRQTVEDLKLHKQFVYVHEAVSDPAPFQYLLPFGPATAAPISYYCVGGGSLGWSMPASLGIKLTEEGWQGIKPRLVVNVVGDGSTLFYPQVWWTAAHRAIAVLYIITNNREYHTLQVGLRQLVQSYGSAPGYRWAPRSNDPEYLRIESPNVDLVALAKAFGVTDGQVVEGPADVAAAVRHGAEFVLKNNRSYVLDVRTAQEVAGPPAAGAAPAGAEAVAPPAEAARRYAAQPPLDFFHREALESAPSYPGAGVPLIS